MKIKLPSLPKLRREPDPPPSTSSSGMRAGAGLQAPATVTMGGLGDRMRLVNRRLRGVAGYVFLFVLVFFVFIWVSLPTRAIAWKAGQAARQAGYIVDIEDVSISPLTGVTLYNVRWTFQPSHAGQIPRTLELPEVDVDVSILGYLMGSYDVTVDTMIEDATIHAEYTRSEDESTIKISITELPLADVPKLQQSVNAPLAGLFALDVDLTMPENKFARAHGSITLACSACTIGDGATPLFMPGSSGIMAKGVTLPNIDLGSLGGKLVVENGKATAEKFETTSDDLTVKISGGMTLADPFTRSELEFDLKLLVTPALQDRSEPLKLMVQTAGPSTKMDGADEGWLGFKLRGSPGKPKFMGIKSKSREERQREARQKALEREAKRKSKSKKKESAKEAKDSDKPSSTAGDAASDTPDSAMRPGTGPDGAPDPTSGDRPEASKPEDSKPNDSKPDDSNSKMDDRGNERPTRPDVRAEDSKDSKDDRDDNREPEKPAEEPKAEDRPEEKPADNPEAAQPPAEGGENQNPEAQKPAEGEGGGGGGGEAGGGEAQ